MLGAAVRPLIHQPLHPEQTLPIDHSTSCKLSHSLKLQAASTNQELAQEMKTTEMHCF